ncbi:MAG: DNA adenine methylase [Deltaproteobacteria bacterium]|nr:DNA adenine methylase [Deltaproteobacteria bacterium]MBN2674844.1 DNA adenine methylase [Deltaproteobacteria bacterium]
MNHRQSPRTHQNDIDEPHYSRMPSTRYLGSKRKLLPALHAVFTELNFSVAADPFCGSGAVSYLLKTMGKEVIAQDALHWNVIGTRAVLSSPVTNLDTVLQQVFDSIDKSNAAPGFVEQNFKDVFFTDEENCFLDRFMLAVSTLSQPQKDVVMFALFQAALAKRPYNLFHRANLYMRTNDVKRSFGNKTTWDASFETLIRKNAAELARAQFVSERKMTVNHRRAEDSDFSNAQLVYLDPPYVSKRGTGVDYLDYYHFLEGLCMSDVGDWKRQMLMRYKHRPLAGRGNNQWCKPNDILRQFEMVLKRCRHAIVVISYRNDGIPSIDELTQVLKRNGKTVERIDCGTYVYALSKNNRSKEMILVGR